MAVGAACGCDTATLAAMVRGSEPRTSLIAIAAQVGSRDQRSRRYDVPAADSLLLADLDFQRTPSTSIMYAPTA